MGDKYKFEAELCHVGLTEKQFNVIKANLFKNCEEEIKFIPRSGHSIDKKVAKIIKLLKIKEVPIVCLSERLYFVGLYKVILEMRGDYLMVQVGNS